MKIRDPIFCGRPPSSAFSSSHSPPWRPGQKLRNDAIRKRNVGRSTSCNPPPAVHRAWCISICCAPMAVPACPLPARASATSTGSVPRMWPKTPPRFFPWFTRTIWPAWLNPSRPRPGHWPPGFMNTGFASPTARYAGIPARRRRRSRPMARYSGADSFPMPPSASRPRNPWSRCLQPSSSRRFRSSLPTPKEASSTLIRCLNRPPVTRAPRPLEKIRASCPPARNRVSNTGRCGPPSQREKSGTASSITGARMARCSGSMRQFHRSLTIRAR